MTASSTDLISALRGEMNELLAGGDYHRALGTALEILAKAPADAQARLCAARIHLGRDQMERAAALLIDGIERAPGDAAYWALLGEVQTRQGEIAAAVESYHRALMFAPDWTQISNNLASLEYGRGRRDEAIDCLNRAIDRNPRCPITRLNLARIKSTCGKMEDALRTVEAATRIAPAWAVPHFEHGRLLAETGNLSEAIAAYDRALQIEPLWADAHMAKGLALREASRIPEALECFNQAALLRPDWHLVHHNIGEAHLRLGRTAKAIESFRKAVGLEPAFYQSHADLGVALLEEGQFEEGWREWEWRFGQGGCIGKSLQCPAPVWDGRSLTGETLIVWIEQGLGDIIQFARFVPLAAARGARVVLQAPSPLRSLLASLPGVSRVVALDQPMPECDYQIPLLSLPHVLEITLNDLPGPIPYLTPFRDEGTDSPIFDGGRDGGSFRVGIVWASNQANSAARERDCSFSLLSRIADLAGVSVFSFQFGDRAADLSSEPNSRVRSIPGGVGDFWRTAVLAMQMDLIVTVDTAMAHLAGALGIPVWVLLPEPADWRWMRDRSDSPWYPTARLFRQSRGGDWEELVDRVAEALRDQCSRKSEPVGRPEINSPDH
ncbi:MAG TPA: tetratricopeptide repeat protein [Blastocatellia bacterium]